jgi:hypothetical protein
MTNHTTFYFSSSEIPALTSSVRMHAIEGLLKLATFPTGTHIDLGKIAITKQSVIAPLASILVEFEAAKIANNACRLFDPAESMMTATVQDDGRILLNTTSFCGLVNIYTIPAGTWRVMNQCECIQAMENSTRLDNFWLLSYSDDYMPFNNILSSVTTTNPGLLEHRSNDLQKLWQFNALKHGDEATQGLLIFDRSLSCLNMISNIASRFEIHSSIFDSWLATDYEYIVYELSDNPQSAIHLIASNKSELLNSTLPKVVSLMKDKIRYTLLFNSWLPIEIQNEIYLVWLSLGGREL